MIRYNASSDHVRQQSRHRHIKASLWLSAVPLAAGLTFWAGLQEARAAPSNEEPFDAASLHFETNATDCDMGVQMFFDSPGTTEMTVKDPSGHVVYSVQTLEGMADVGGLTESFLEGVEPQITELLSKLGCDLSDEEPQMSLQELVADWPAGTYRFQGSGGGTDFESEAVLSHKIPAGPNVTAPEEGDIVRDDLPLLVTWNKVTSPIIPGLGPVEIIGYHVVIEDESGPTLPGPVPLTFDADVGREVTRLRVPPQYLRPNRVYSLEVLATEKSGNQTLTGVIFCTRPRTAAACEAE
jgi:hypothetical protein